ncbi:MAG: hypothetical protein JW919_02175 [Candidatus Omnitrophica bacterium]|nr:hypothetical protein [Candidatus Omnitrophota bacterium]
MKKAIAILLILFLCANSAFAIDGRQWKEMDNDQKARYLMGVYEGMAFYESTVLRRPYEDWEIKKHFPTQFPVHVIIQSVDLFYADANNTLFPLASVLYIMTMELGIENKEAVELYKNRLRRSIRQQ